MVISVFSYVNDRLFTKCCLITEIRGVNKAKLVHAEPAG
jgi:hypothetical protein